MPGVWPIEQIITKRKMITYCVFRKYSGPKDIIIQYYHKGEICHQIQKKVKVFAFSIKIILKNYAKAVISHYTDLMFTIFSVG